MREYPLAKRAGVTRKSIEAALEYQKTEEDLFRFLHGNMYHLHAKMPEPSYKQSWDRTGKRFVHLEEVRFITRHLLRNNIYPQSKRALIISGTEPALACIPWALSGLVSDFEAYENSIDTYLEAASKRAIETHKLYKAANDDTSLEIIFGDCFRVKNKDYGIFDLDFCNNHLKTKDSRDEILQLINNNSVLEGPIILRITIHVGRLGNSRSDTEEHINLFNEELRNKYKIRAHDISPYQSSVPMTSLIWILERKDILEDNKNLKLLKKPEKVDRKRATFLLSNSLTNELRNIAINLSGPPEMLTLSDITEKVLELGLCHLKEEYTK
jgi:hypothetical protein